MLAAGLGQPWTRDGGIPQGCPLSMMFMSCSLSSLPVGTLVLSVGSRPTFMLIILSVCLGTLTCFCGRLDLPLVMFGWLVEETAPSKCVLLSTSKSVRAEMRGWVLSDEGHRWTVKLDIRDLGGHSGYYLFVDGLPLCLLEFVLSFLVLILFLPFLLDGYGACACCSCYVFALCSSWC